MSTAFHVPVGVDLVDKHLKINTIWMQLLTNIANLFNSGYTGTVTITKLTGGGANGTLTYKNGILVKVVAAT